MMRLPWFDYRAPRTLSEAARILAGEGPNAALIAGGTDLLPNEAPPERAQGLGQPAPHTGAQAQRRRIRRGHHSHRDRAQARAAALSAPGGGAGGDRAFAQHGHDRRQSLPRYALQLL